MNKLASPHRCWYAPWRAVAPQDDPADLGTAFGLDLSMAPAVSATAQPGVVAGARRSGWVRRWVNRRRAAT